MKNNRGQSTIEFLFGFIFVFTSMFVFLKIAFNYTNGYFVHYATFMASRAYLTFDNNGTSLTNTDNKAKERAQQVFDELNVGQFINGFTAKLQANAPGSGINNLYRGVFVEYDQRFSTSKMFGGAQELKFRSESFLGREPTRAECLKRTCEMLRELSGASSCDKAVTISDNGC